MQVDWVAFTLIIAYLSFTGYALWLIVRNALFDRRQKIFQVLLVLFFPVVGAILIYMVSDSHSNPGSRKQEDGFVPDDESPGFIAYSEAFSGADSYSDGFDVSE